MPYGPATHFQAVAPPPPTRLKSSFSDDENALRGSMLFLSIFSTAEVTEQATLLSRPLQPFTYYNTPPPSACNDSS